MTLQLPSKNSKVLWDSNSQSGSPLENVWIHSFTFSYTPGNMKCDSRASFLACTFASLCFSRKPKAKVMTSTNHTSSKAIVWAYIIDVCVWEMFGKLSLKKTKLPIFGNCYSKFWSITLQYFRDWARFWFG